MEDIPAATAVSTSTAPRRDSALLNQSLDDIIKHNRVQRRNEKKTKGRVSDRKPQNQNQAQAQVQGQKRNNQNRNHRNNNKNKMMDTTPVRPQVQKQRAPQRDTPRAKLIVRSNSGRPASFDRADRNRRPPVVASSTPGLRQPWEKLPVAPLPAEPLKISIRNELADRPARRSDTLMMDTEPVSHPHHSHHVSSAPASASMYQRPAYEPRDALSARDEYRIGNRFATQGMAIDYQLPSGASFDTRPTRRY